MSEESTSSTPENQQTGSTQPDATSSQNVGGGAAGAGASAGAKMTSEAFDQLGHVDAFKSRVKANFVASEGARGMAIKAGRVVTCLGGAYFLTHGIKKTLQGIGFVSPDVDKTTGKEKPVGLSTVVGGAVLSALSVATIIGALTWGGKGRIVGSSPA